MGKSSRKKKEKAKDFTKPKLKVGKKLAKAANVTETAFKTASVYLPTQLKKAGDGVVATPRGVTVKGLLQQLTHFNWKTRASALSDLADLCTLHKEIVTVELGPILNGAGPLAADSEKRVRQEFARVLRVVVENVSSERLGPYMNLLCAHIACAQTHLSESVCNDACTLVDMLMEAVDRDLALSHGTQLLCNLVSHVSGRLKSLSSYGAQEVKSSGRGRASDSAEQAVLRKQLDYLRSVYNCLVALAPAVLDGVGVGDSSTEAQPLRVRAVTGECVLYRFSTDMTPKPPTFDSFDLQSASSSSLGGGKSAGNPWEAYSRLIQQVEPLLSEFWAHASPKSLFQRVRAGRAPAGMEFSLLSIKSFSVLIDLVMDLLSTWQQESTASLVQTVQPQLEDIVRVSLQCASLFHSNLKDTPRCLDLQLALCRELSSLSRLIVVVSKVSEGRASAKGSLPSMASEVRTQSQNMAQTLVSSLKRLASHDVDSSNTTALSQAGELVDILAELHTSREPGCTHGAVRTLDLDYGALLSVAMSLALRLLTRLPEVSEDAPQLQLVAGTCQKVFGFLDTVVMARQHDPPYLARLCSSAPTVPDLVRDWVADLLMVLSPALFSQPALCQSALSHVLTYAVRNPGCPRLALSLHLYFKSTLLDRWPVEWLRSLVLPVLGQFHPVRAADMCPDLEQPVLVLSLSELAGVVGC